MLNRNTIACKIICSQCFDLSAPPFAFRWQLLGKDPNVIAVGRPECSQPTNRFGDERVIWICLCLERCKSVAFGVESLGKRIVDARSRRMLFRIVVAAEIFLQDCREFRVCLCSTQSVGDSECGPVGGAKLAPSLEPGEPGQYHFTHTSSLTWLPSPCLNLPFALGGPSHILDLAL